MEDLFFDVQPVPENDKGYLELFVDEAGDPTLFNSSGKPIVGTDGCSRFFILGKLEVREAPLLASQLSTLRHELLADPYFDGVESFKPERKKTALSFHAKDDLPEVRYRVFNLLRAAGSTLRFHAVVCDKQALLQREVSQREQNPGYRYQPNALYDTLVHSLFAKFHRLADRYELCVARRGHKDRNHAIAQALERAELEFEAKFGFSRGGKDVWGITISDPKTTVCLQAADYFLWAVQRFYEARPHQQTGEEIREERFLRLLWPQIGEIHDLDFGPSYGTFFNKQRPLILADRFGAAGRKKKKP